MSLAKLQEPLPDMVVRNVHEAMLAALDATNADLRGVNPAAVRVLAKELLDFRQEVAAVWAKMDAYGAPGSTALFSVLQKHNPFAEVETC